MLSLRALSPEAPGRGLYLRGLCLPNLTAAMEGPAHDLAPVLSEWPEASEELLHPAGHAAQPIPGQEGRLRQEWPFSPVE